MNNESRAFPAGAGTLNPLDAEVHLETEALLRETLEYLIRLPAHPLTARLATKVRAHLDSPMASVARSRAVSDALAQRAHRQNRNGVSRYTPNGIPVLLVSVGQQEVRLSSPAAQTYGSTSQGRKFAQELAAELASGVTVDLLGPNSP